MPINESSGLQVFQLCMSSKFMRITVCCEGSVNIEGLHQKPGGHTPKANGCLPLLVTTTATILTSASPPVVGAERSQIRRSRVSNPRGYGGSYGAIHSSICRGVGNLRLGPRSSSPPGQGRKDTEGN